MKMINVKLQNLCNEWELDMKGDMLEDLDEILEVHKTIKNYIIYIVNECFPIWIDEADDDNKEVYIEYQLKFRNVLKEL